MRFWSDGERHLRANTRASTTYGTFPPPEEYVSGWSYWSYTVMPSGQPWRDVHPLFYPIDTRLVGRERRNGTRHYRVESVGIANRKLFAMTEGVESPRDVRLRAVVDRRGLVRHYRLILSDITI